MSPPTFSRVLLKLSGEALMGPLEYGTDPDQVRQIAAAVRRVTSWRSCRAAATSSAA
jgi:uridylate kinase